MSGETGEVESGWTTDTIRAHFEQRIHDLETKLDERYATQTKALDAALVAAEKAVETALLSAEKAVTKAEAANEKRFEAANEWRGQSADRERSQQQQMAELTSTFLPREVADALLAELRKTVDENTRRVNAIVSEKAGSNAAVAWVVAATAVVISLVSVVANVLTG